MKKVNLVDSLLKFSELWNPKIVGELNDHYLKLAKLKGEFVWHHHEEEDELFLVIKGQLTILFRTGQIVLTEGEFLIVPRGVEHKPQAEEEVHVLLMEPKSTINTGNIRNERTVDLLDSI
jgi:mannose-6-phosphate isomerase-like protein (cupin superfamily)